MVTLVEEKFIGKGGAYRQGMVRRNELWRKTGNGDHFSRPKRWALPDITSGK